MASQSINVSPNTVGVYSTFSAFPLIMPIGSQGLAFDTSLVYIYAATGWEPVGGPGSITSIGAFSATPTAQGLVVSANALSLTAADGTHPGGLSISGQTIAGIKTFSSAPNLSSLTASQILSLDASKNVTTTVATGSGSVVLASGPTIDSPSFTTSTSISGTVNIGSLAANKVVSTDSLHYLSTISYAAAPTNNYLVQYGSTGNVMANAFISPTANISSVGILRLASTESIGWRNNANSANLTLSTNSSDQFVLSNGILAPSLLGATDNSASGAYLLRGDSTANTSTAITLGQGLSQRITLTANTTITMPTLPASGKMYEVLLEIIQNNSTAYTVSWAGSPAIIWATPSAGAPPVNSVLSSSTYIYFRGTSGTWVGYSSGTLGVIDGSNASTGMFQEFVTSSIAVGSQVSLTTATAATITSIPLGPGDWTLSGGLIYNPAGTTTVSAIKGSISTTTNVHATAPNGGAYFNKNMTFTTGAEQAEALASFRVNITSTTTYYLVASSSFAISTMGCYGVISARRAAR